MANVIKGKNVNLLNLQICLSTAGLFADMLNPTMRGPNFRFTPEKLADLSFTSGYFPSGYLDTDIVKKYEGLPDTCSVKEYWIEHATHFAKRLIEGAGINELGNWDDKAR
ncbi:MAG: hypothetical protein WC358_10815 [Ignavibacteria bacterium]|jgi:hypothetical protein